MCCSSYNVPDPQTLKTFRTARSLRCQWPGLGPSSASPTTSRSNSAPLFRHQPAPRPADYRTGRPPALRPFGSPAPQTSQLDRHRPEPSLPAPEQAASCGQALLAPGVGGSGETAAAAATLRGSRPAMGRPQSGGERAGSAPFLTDPNMASAAAAREDDTPRVADGRRTAGGSSWKVSLLPSRPANGRRTTNPSFTYPAGCG
ncbi:predicted GPI-anchored protein 58 [Orycteropus afer afer]|uniref:Predicted GPI-anchored protein 58 n=1 Tax=Orycteropus afer afer TaxID=1230840 RepID=A0AC54ZE56_ORYAF|nr:predicted GPI-anchored protein 58 [Orycteropus afer afer]